jgi:hypothetical protein
MVRSHKSLACEFIGLAHTASPECCAPGVESLESTKEMPTAGCLSADAERVLRYTMHRLKPALERPNSQETFLISNCRKLSILGAVLVFAAPFAFGDTLQMGSFASGAPVPAGDVNTAMNYAGYSATSSTASTGTGASYTLTPGTVWSAAVPNSTWVGYAASSGPGGTNPALGYYTFTTTFSALGGSNIYSGTLALLADDTAEVFLNGSLLVSFGALGADSHCAAGQPSCTTADNVALSGLSLNSGVGANVLTFVVQQAGNEATGQDPSGLDFDATLASTSTPTPEPSTLLLLGTAMFGGAGGILMRRKHIVACGIA